MLLVIVLFMVGTGVMLWILANLLGEEEPPSSQPTGKSGKKPAELVTSILAENWTAKRPKPRTPSPV